jgi:hypothetical protein
MPGKRRRNSIAAENSPFSKYVVRMAAAVGASTQNMGLCAESGKRDGMTTLDHW